MNKSTKQKRERPAAGFFKSNEDVKPLLLSRVKFKLKRNEKERRNNLKETIRLNFYDNLSLTRAKAPSFRPGFILHSVELLFSTPSSSCLLISDMKSRSRNIPTSDERR